MRLLLSALLLGLLAACSSASMSLRVNGVSVENEGGRPSVPGGTGFSISVKMAPVNDGTGRLWIDGVDYGDVRSGDKVRIDRHAVVRVNGEERGAAKPKD